MFNFVTPLLEMALPSRCAACGAILRDDAHFCGDCWSKLQFLTGEGCLKCNSPVVNSGMICAPCMAKPPSHDGVRAAVRYGTISSGLAIRLKHGRRIGLARVMARAMMRHVNDPDAVLVPVPLHRSRIWRRGFNQSALIAKAISRKGGNILVPDLLTRTKPTPILGGLSARDREKALRGAIKMPTDKRSLIRDKAVYLVDDVYTSGATGNACARALKRAGAAKVTILCWARVLKETDLSN